MAKKNTGAKKKGAAPSGAAADAVGQQPAEGVSAEELAKGVTLPASVEGWDPAHAKVKSSDEPTTRQGAGFKQGHQG